GFSEADVNMNAPSLFTDLFCISYVNHMARAGLLAYGGSLGMSIRKDIRDYFIEGISETTKLYDKSTQVMLNKGIFLRAPYIPVPTETDYIDSKKYLGGFNLLSDKRPLNAIEISHLYLNIQTNHIGMKISLAFAQTSPLKEVQDFLLTGKEISKKHMKIFMDSLLGCDIEAPMSPDHGISDSTTQTFSDKLIMFHMALLSASGTGNYATAAAASQRNDLATSYERLSLEIATFAKSGADIMIKNNWLEQPPGTKDKTKLVKNKHDGH
ncbi:DUF3231 family protein, partial [Streptomyces sp. NPDC014727]